MKIFALGTVSFLLSISTSFAQAPEDLSCAEGVGNAVIDFVGRDKVTRVANLTCKKSQSDANVTIAVLAYEPPGYVEMDDFPYVIALVEQASKVVASFQSAIVIEGGTMVSQSSFKIDTARYVLSKSTRAFGVRFVGISTPRCADAGWDDELTLYVRDGSKLRPVLGPTATFYQVAREGGLCGTGVIDYWKLQLSIAASASNGYADIVADFKSETTKSVRCVFSYSGIKYKSDLCFVAHIKVD